MYLPDATSLNRLLFVIAVFVNVQVRVVASLPCYSAANVDAQRGGGVFRRSVAGLQRLNAAGYGRPGSHLHLDLVYNPAGLFLAPPQAQLEPAYKRELKEAFDVDFNALLCLNNMPIKRYWEYLERRGELEEYMKMLVDSFNGSAGEALMCRDTVSVAWDGSMCAACPRCMSCVQGMVSGSHDSERLLRLLPVAVAQVHRAVACAHLRARRMCCNILQGVHCLRRHHLHQYTCGNQATACRYDCDFNQQLELPAAGGPTVFDVGNLSELTGRRIACGSHCFGCTAGSGSSCQGQ